MSELHQHRDDVCRATAWSTFPNEAREEKREELAQLEAALRDEESRVTWDMLRANSEALAEMSALLAQSEADRRRMAKRVEELERLHETGSSSGSERRDQESEAIFARIFEALRAKETGAQTDAEDDWFLELTAPDPDDDAGK